MASTEGNLTGSSSRSSTDSPYGGDRRSSDEIRRDIERQRDELDVTADVLQHRLAPRELAGQLWNDVRDRVGGSAGDMADLAKRHPVPLGLIGAGIAWWIFETSSGRGLSFGNGDYDEEDIGVGSTSTGSYGSNYAKRSAFAAGSGYDSGDEASASWRERSLRAAQRSTERLRVGATSARQGFSEAIDRNPLALGAACFSLGILAAIAVPASNWEERNLGDASARVGRKAKDAAKEVAVKAAEEGARAVQNAADRLRDEVDRPIGSSGWSSGLGDDTGRS